MQVVYLYGPPGVGKLTVGTALAALTGYRLVHNHLTVNLATALFPRGSPAWARFLGQVRGQVFAAAAREGVDLISTAAYLGTAEQVAAIRAWLEPVRASGGAVMFVRLACDQDELVRRVQHAARLRHEKPTDPRVLDRYDLTATMPVGSHLRLDTTHLSPAAAAARIAAYYRLPVAPA